MKTQIIRTRIIIATIAVVSLSLSSCHNKTQEEAAGYVYYLGESPAQKIGDVKAVAALVLNTTDFNGEFVNNPNDGNTYYSSADGSVRFQQNQKTGSFTFTNSMKDYMGQSHPALPSEEEAPKIAEDYLRKLNLYPADENQLVIGHVGGYRSTSVIDGKRAGEIIDKIRTVTYTRTIDSIPVIGPGSKVIVRLGDKNSLLGMIYRWRNLSLTQQKLALKPEELITEKEAKNQLAERVAGDFGKDAQFDIISTQKSLYDGEGSILQPVYSFEVKINEMIDKQRRESFTYLYIIQQMKESPEPLNFTAMPPEAKQLIQTIKANNQQGNENPGKD